MTASPDQTRRPLSGVDVSILDYALTSLPQPLPDETTTGARRRASVAAIFTSGSVDTELLFIQRASFGGDPWSGQMAFPGGRVEPTDADSFATAERETLEEIGVDLSGAHRLGSLAEVDGGRGTNRSVVVAGHCYWLDGGPAETTPNHEVADIVWVPLSHLLDEARYIDYLYRPAGGHFPGIQLDKPEQVIWGLTLRFLADLMIQLDRPFII